MNFNQQAQNLCRWTMPSSVKKVVPAFLLLFSSQLHVTANAQRISLSLNKGTFREAVESIKKQSGYELVLVQTHLGDTHPVSLNLQNKGLRESLEALTKDQPVGYEIKGNDQWEGARCRWYAAERCDDQSQRFIQSDTDRQQW